MIIYLSAFVIICQVFFSTILARNNISRYDCISGYFLKKAHTAPIILQIRFGMNGVSGGIATHFAAAYDHMKKNGLETIFLTKKNTGLHNSLIKKKLSHYAIAKNIFDINYFEKVLSYINQKSKIGILHTHDLSLIPLIKNFATKNKIPIVATFHSSVAPKNIFTLKGCNTLICVTPNMTEWMKKANITYSLGINRIFFTPPFICIKKQNIINENTINKPLFFSKNFNININSNDPLLCCIANFYTCKNHEKLLESLYILKEKYNISVTLLLAGSGNKDRILKLKKLSTIYGISDKVHFLGFTDKVNSILYYADIKILPSIADAFPVCLMEAALSKKAIIASSIIGSANVFIKHNETGLLFNSQNAEELAQCILLLIKNKPLRDKLAINAYNLVQEYISDEYYSNILSTHYNKIIFEI